MRSTWRHQRQRLGSSTTAADRLVAEHPENVGALEDQFNQTTDGSILKLLNVIEEHIRQALVIHLSHTRPPHGRSAQWPSLPVTHQSSQRGH